MLQAGLRQAQGEEGRRSLTKLGAAQPRKADNVVMICALSEREEADETAQGCGAASFSWGTPTTTVALPRQSQGAAGFAPRSDDARKRYTQVRNLEMGAGAVTLQSLVGAPRAGRYRTKGSYDSLAWSWGKVQLTQRADSDPAMTYLLGCFIAISCQGA